MRAVGLGAASMNAGVGYYSPDFYEIRADTSRILAQALRFEAVTNIVLLHWHAARLTAQQAMARRRIHRRIARACNACQRSERQECLTQLYGSVRAVRDSLINGQRAMENYAWTRHLAWMWAGPIAGWDELTEDLSIAADQEVHDLVGRIAHAA